VHQLLLIKSQFNRSIPSDVVPLTKEFKINFQSLIILALEKFSKVTLLNAFSIAFKQNKAPDKVPEEAVYHYELYTILKSWLPSQLYVVMPEINANPLSKRERCDLLISYNTIDNPPLLIEIAASISKIDLAKHLKKLQRWKKIKNTETAWIIIFSLSPVLPIWPDVTSGLNCIHVWHDTTVDWMNVTINNDYKCKIILK